MDRTRKLASIRRITSIKPVENSDFLEVAVVDGWKVVIKKGDFKIGDLAVYFEIDSWIPTELAPFLTKNAAKPREYNGIQGERLKTIRLRGQISQGLLLPLERVEGTPYVTGYFHLDGIGTMVMVQEDDDVTEALNIQKWEPVLDAKLQGVARGSFPTHLIRKTDQERVQNIYKYLVPGSVFETTLKMDGSSCTIFRHEGILRVCSRNLELQINDENSENAFVKMALRHGENIPDNYGVQGEVMGPGIQGNREGFSEVLLFVFDVFDIAEQEYLLPKDRKIFCEVHDLPHVPWLDFEGAITDEFSVTDIGSRLVTLEDILAFAEGKSLKHAIREGVVFKNINGPRYSFKAINNEFLLRGGN